MGWHGMGMPCPCEGERRTDGPVAAELDVRAFRRRGWSEKEGAGRGARRGGAEKSRGSAKGTAEAASSSSVVLSVSQRASRQAVSLNAPRPSQPGGGSDASPPSPVQLVRRRLRPCLPACLLRLRRKGRPQPPPDRPTDRPSCEKAPTHSFMTIQRRALPSVWSSSLTSNVTASSWALAPGSFHGGGGGGGWVAAEPSQQPRGVGEVSAGARAEGERVGGGEVARW